MQHCFKHTKRNKNKKMSFKHDSEKQSKAKVVILFICVDMFTSPANLRFLTFLTPYVTPWHGGRCSVFLMSRSLNVRFSAIRHYLHGLAQTAEHPGGSPCDSVLAEPTLVPVVFVTSVPPTLPTPACPISAYTTERCTSPPRPDVHQVSFLASVRTSFQAAGFSAEAADLARCSETYFHG